MDQKMWNLVLLLGESYLVLGEAYKDGEQLHRALKVVELACLVYGSMPQHLDDARYISSLGNGESYQQSKKGDGHGRRSLAEELVSQLDELRGHGILQNACEQAIKTAKAEYLQSLNYYVAAKMELDSMGSSEDNSLHKAVHTQLAHIS
ncbi:hypothetical protein HPP92_025156 [Vanilla planifolia]|uniref:Uncharacterized protein n=1 Tax=Vanilla planifolia TaxID=51239 RepID=A0A835PJ02_VANPL|nr:hypothetical protein HPP92_025156 [Vanilla planifolia]